MKHSRETESPPSSRNKKTKEGKVKIAKSEKKGSRKILECPAAFSWPRIVPVVELPTVLAALKSLGPFGQNLKNDPAAQQRRSFFALGLNESTKAAERDDLVLLFICCEMGANTAMLSHIPTLSVAHQFTLVPLPLENASFQLGTALGVRSVVALGVRKALFKDPPPAAASAPPPTDSSTSSMPPAFIEWLMAARRTVHEAEQRWGGTPPITPEQRPIAESIRRAAAEARAHPPPPPPPIVRHRRSGRAKPRPEKKTAAVSEAGATPVQPSAALSAAEPVSEKSAAPVQSAAPEELAESAPAAALAKPKKATAMPKQKKGLRQQPKRVRKMSLGKQPKTRGLAASPLPPASPPSSPTTPVSSSS